MKKKSEYFMAEIRFNVGKRKISFNVVHNLPETFGLSMDCAVESWVHRTNKYTAESLCKYINDKDTGYVCMTEKEFMELYENWKKEEAGRT